MRVAQHEPIASAGGEAIGFEGESPSRSVAGPLKLKLDPLCNFVFLGHPYRWDAVITADGPKLLPQLRTFYFEPGRDGVEQIKGEQDGNAVAAVARLQQAGWILIDPEMVVAAFGVERQGYVVRYKAGYKGPVHLSAWQKPYALGGKVEIDFDEEGWHLFLEGLIGKRIPAPTASTVRAIRVKLQRAYRKRATHATTNATARAAAEIYEQKLEALPLRPAAPLGFEGSRPGTPAGRAPDEPSPSQRKAAEKAAKTIADKAASDAIAKAAADKAAQTDPGKVT